MSTEAICMKLNLFNSNLSQTTKMRQSGWFTLWILLHGKFCTTGFVTECIWNDNFPYQVPLIHTSEHVTGLNLPLCYKFPIAKSEVWISPSTLCDWKFSRKSANWSRISQSRDNHECWTIYVTFFRIHIFCNAPACESL